MIRLLWPLMLFALVLNARENPFAPPRKVSDIPLQTPISTPAMDKELVPLIQQAQCVAAPKAPEPQKPEKVWKKFPPERKETVQPAAKPSVIVTKRKKVTGRHAMHPLKKRRVTHFRPIYRNDNLKIYLKPGRIKIVTTDCLQKHFTLRAPHRLVLDFGDDFVIYRSVSKPLHTGAFRRLKIGTHACSYRVTFTLSKAPRYTIRRKRYGYLITLY